LSGEILAKEDPGAILILELDRGKFRGVERRELIGRSGRGTT
jgi:hypothetical protein